MQLSSGKKSLKIEKL